MKNSTARAHYLDLRVKHGPMKPRRVRIAGLRTAHGSALDRDYVWFTDPDRLGVYTMNIPATVLGEPGEPVVAPEPPGLFQVNPNPWKPEPRPPWYRRWGRAYERYIEEHLGAILLSSLATSASWTFWFMVLPRV